jgi:hypothetical protein
VSISGLLRISLRVRVAACLWHCADGLTPGKNMGERKRKALIRTSWAPRKGRPQHLAHSTTKRAWFDHRYLTLATNGLTLSCLETLQDHTFPNGTAKERPVS